MTSDSGSVMRQVAIAAMDTRVILGALVGWSLLSRAFGGKKKSSRRAHETSQPIQHVLLEGEIVSLKATLMKQSAENNALVAQVAQLRAGRTKPYTVQRNGAVKALAEAFQAAADEPHTPERLAILSEAAAISEKIPAAFGSPTPIQEDNDEGEWAEVANIAHSIPSVGSSNDLESLRLAQENEELRRTVQRLTRENAELADRMVEVAFIETESQDDNVDEVDSAQQPLGMLRGVLLSQNSMEEESPRDSVSNESIDTKKDDYSYLEGFDGPKTPELGGQSAPSAAALEHATQVQG